MPDRIALRKAIVSHLGEVTQDTRAEGDQIRFRIHYTNITPATADIIIRDTVNASLTRVTVSNDGRYDVRTRTIAWEIKAVGPGRTGFVEWEATVGSAGRVSNEASVEGIGPRVVKSNVVEVNAVKPPKLGWIPLVAGAKEGEPPRVWMKDETTSGATVRIDIPGVFVTKEVVDGVAYQRFAVPGRGVLTDIGKPELPLAGEYIEVPFEVNFTPTVVQSAKVQLDGYHVYPAQPPRPERLAPRPVFRVDALTYQTSAEYPAVPAVLEAGDVAVIRGHRVAGLKLNPFQYNPVTRKLTAYSMLEVSLKYSHPAQIKRVPRRLESRAFEDLLAALVLNYKEPRRLYEPEGGLEEGGKTAGCDYLIITHDAFYNATDPNNPLVRFADWKRRKGYTTNVVKVGSISGGNTAASIKAYIQNAYDNWAPVPTHILLVGDSGLIASNPGGSHTPPIETDLYYVTVDGADYFPDIYVGRFSADTIQHVTDIVDKVLAYEQNAPATPANAGFYNNVSLAGVFTENGGSEDFPWISDLETIRNYLTGRGYAVERIYATDSGFPANPAAPTPQSFQDGTALPADLRFPQYGWAGDTADISAALNAGRFLIAYRGHGSWDGWSQPSFANTDVTTLVQNRLTPLFLSITCQTGWFDNETDDDAHGGRPAAADCYAETLLRQPRSGAVAAMAMTRNSWPGFNDFLVFGFLKSIWPDFAPNPPWSGFPTAPQFTPVRLLRMGQIVNFGRMFMAKAYGVSDDRKREFEMCHLFGDPEMPIWTEAPPNLAVDHPKGIGATGTQEFIVTVANAGNGQAVQGIAVVLTRGTTIMQVCGTDTFGVARFSLSNPGAGDRDITATGTGFRPYQGVIEVRAGGAELNRLDPIDGPENQTILVGGQGFQAGEHVDLYFGSDGPKTVTADATGKFGQPPATVDLTVPLGCAHGPVNVWATGQSSHRCASRIFQVRDVNPVDIYTYDQWDASTWSLHPGDNPTWNSPDIQLYDKNGNPADSANLTLGETYTVKVNIRNNASFAAAQSKVVFEWANYGAGGPWQTFDTKSVDVPAGSGPITVAETEYAPQATGHLCIRVELSHLEDTKSSNNAGQENLHVGYSGSPTKVSFMLWNQTKEASPVFIEVRQLLDPWQSGTERIWATVIQHPDPQVLAPGDRGEAWVTIDPEPADVKPGTKAEFAVTAYVGGTMIGGVNAIITKK